MSLPQHVFVEHFENGLDQWLTLMGHAQVIDRRLSIDISPSRDSWAYLCPRSGDLWRDYVFSIGFNRLSTFRELALNFRHIDFNNRYRFRFESDNRLYFDKKVNGKWFNDMKHTRFKVQDGKWYKALIKCSGNNLSCMVDGEPLLEAQDNDIMQGKIAIVCWDDRMKHIRALFNEVRVDLSSPPALQSQKMK